MLKRVCTLSTLLFSLAASSRVIAEQPSAKALGSTGSDIWQVFIALIAVLALFMAVAWLMRKMQFGSLGQGGNRITLLSGQALTTRERVVLLEVDGVRMLVGVAPGRVTPIHVFDSPRTDHCASANDSRTDAGSARTATNNEKTGFSGALSQALAKDKSS